MKPPVAQLSILQLADILDAAGVFAIMGRERRRHVTVDYIPPRDAMIFARETDDGPMETFAPTPMSLTFCLEDAMFGGVTFVAITCGGRVVINPVVFESYDKLAIKRVVRS